MKVKFLEDVEVRDAQNKVEATFEKDQAYDLRDSSANHWIARRKAEPVDAGNPAQAYMAEGAQAPALKDRKARSTDDVAAQKKADDAAAAARKAGADPDSTQRVRPDALSSADLRGPAGTAAPQR